MATASAIQNNCSQANPCDVSRFAQKERTSGQLFLCRSVCKGAVFQSLGFEPEDDFFTRPGSVLIAVRARNV